MKLPKTLFVVLALAALIIACTFTTTRTNRDEDRDAAEKVTNKLFEDLKNKNYDAAYSLFSDSVWVNTPKEKLKELFVYSDNKLGAMQKDSLADWKSRIVGGTTNSADYQLIYKNHYEKGTAEVNIVLTGEKGKIKILGYHINSEQFLAK